MATYTVKKVVKVDMAETPVLVQYEFTSYRSAIDDKGVKVNVEHRKNIVTLEGLQAELAVVQGKIDAINALEEE